MSRPGTESVRGADRMIAVALDMIVEGGVADLTLTALARRCRVSRATAYREFGDKDSLLSAVVTAEVTRMVQATAAGLDLTAPAPIVVRDSVVFAIRYLRAHAGFVRVRDHEPHLLLGVIVERHGTRLDLVETVIAHLTPVLAASGDALAVRPEQAAEICVRTVLSHALIERSTLTDEEAGTAVARAVGR